MIKHGDNLILMTKRFLMLIIICFALYGCSDSDIVLLSDQYWDEIYISRNKSVESISKYAAQAGLKTDFQRVEIDNQVLDITGIVGDISAPWIILSPLFSYQAEDLILKYPEKKFIRYGYSESESEGIITLHTDRREVYKEAGEVCASYLMEIQKNAGEQSADSGETVNSNMGAVFYSGNAQGIDEMDSFSAGFSAAGDKTRLFVKTISDLESRREVQRILNELKTEEIGCLLISVSGLNSYCMELLNTGSWKIITDNWKDSGINGDRMLFSIEEDMDAAMKMLFSNIKSGKPGSVVIPSFLYYVSPRIP